MAATIDHLRVDHSVRVIRAFVDAHGLAVPSEATGIIRAMGLDTSQMELWIEWEREGTRERLRFALRAPAGPGNGRMRDYFELAAPAPDVRVADSTTVQQTARPEPRPTPTPARTTTLAPHDVPLDRVVTPTSYPPAGTILDERAVACACDVAFHRPVLVEHLGLNACMRCGAIALTHTVGDDGRFTGNASYAHIVDPLSDAQRAWLARWPRITVHRPADPFAPHIWSAPAGLTRREIIYLPADARCDSLAALQQLEVSCADRLPTLPTSPPPGALPVVLQSFAQFGDAARLTPHSELTQLLAVAEASHPASGIAVALVQQRADAFEVMVHALQSDDPIHQSAGAAIAYATTPVDDRLPDVLIGIINGLPVRPRPDVPDRMLHRRRLVELLAVILDQRILTSGLRTALGALQRRLVRIDTDLTTSVGLVLRTLHAT